MRQTSSSLLNTRIRRSLASFAAAPLPALFLFLFLPSAGLAAAPTGELPEKTAITDALPVSAQQSLSQKQTASPASEATEFAVTAESPFPPVIGPEMARAAASAALDLKAAEEGQLLLARQPEIRQSIGQEIASGRSLPELTVFGRLLLRRIGPLEEKLGSGPDGRILKLTASYEIVAPDEQRALLRNLLDNNALLENLGLGVQMEKESLDAYHEAVRQLAAAPGLNGPDGANADGRPLTSAARGKGEVLQAFESLLAIRAYLDLLPSLYDPERLSPLLLPGLEKASESLPDNYLLAGELGRLYLWLEHTDKAMKTLNSAIALNPDFAQAYSHRGTLWLLLHKPSLALADLDRAVELDQNNAEFRHNRAVVWKALGNAAAMCADLRQSCALGQCAAYEWAFANGECR